MQPKFKVLVTFIILVLLVAGLSIFTNWFSLITGYFSGEGETAKLARCLQNQRAEFYGSLYCPDCQEQINLFGSSFELISYIDCGKDNANCPNIREIPAWYINKKIYYGFKTLTELKEISGCG